MPSAIEITKFLKRLGRGPTGGDDESADVGYDDCDDAADDDDDCCQRSFSARNACSSLSRSDDTRESAP
jgi:hypothetical protein